MTNHKILRHTKALISGQIFHYVLYVVDFRTSACFGGQMSLGRIFGCLKLPVQEVLSFFGAQQQTQGAGLFPLSASSSASPLWPRRLPFSEKNMSLLKGP